MNVRQIAKLYGCTPNAVYSSIQRGHLKVNRKPNTLPGAFGTDWKYEITDEDAAAWAAKRKQKASQAARNRAPSGVSFTLRLEKAKLLWSDKALEDILSDLNMDAGAKLARVRLLEWLISDNQQASYRAITHLAGIKPLPEGEGGEQLEWTESLRSNGRGKAGRKGQHLRVRPERAGLRASLGGVSPTASELRGGQRSGSADLPEGDAEDDLRGSDLSSVAADQ